MKSLFVAFACAALAASAAAQTAQPAAWDAGCHPPQTARLQVWRGDTVPLAPRWGSQPTNGWTFAAYWSTNGAAWWSKGWATNSTVVGDPFLWTPDMDAGARRYRLFIRASDAVGGSYRANAEIAMLDSPGADPASLPPPSAYPTLAADLLPLLLPSVPNHAAWTNEAALRAAGDLSGSNHVHAVRTNLQAQIDAIGPQSGGGPASAGEALRLVSEDGTRWADGDLGVWSVTDVDAIIVSGAGTEKANGIYYLEYIAPEGHGHYTNTIDGSMMMDAGADTAVILDQMSDYYIGYGSAPDYVWEQAPYGGIGASPWPTSRAAGSLTNLVDRLATQSRLAAATNELVRTYFVSTNAWLSVDYSNATVSVSMVSTNGTNTVTLGTAAPGIDPQATNLLWQALAQGLAAKADRAWGQYSPAGQANPDPDYMTWLSAPATVFASGSEWSSSGSYAVLTTPGMIAHESGSNGVFRISSDSTNWFGIVSGGSVLVGARPGAITVVGGGTEGGYAELVFDHDGGEFPTLWFAPSLRVDFSVVSSAVWTDNMDGSATVAAPATTAAGFWRATTTASYDRYFECTMPARLSGGLIAATNSAPVVYDSVITVSSGGKTYRVPAQEVR